jgi:hypothetical protein
MNLAKAMDIELAEFRDFRQSMPARRKSVWRLKSRKSARYNHQSQPLFYLTIKNSFSQFLHSTPD